MTTYSIKAPDGNTYDIEGPDGATDEQVRARVLAAHPQAAAPSAARVAQNAEDAKIRAQGGTSGNPIMDALAGSGKAMTDMWLGGKQLAASLGMGDKEALAKEVADKQKLDAPLMNTGAGMVGKYGTDIASSFLPMGLASKAIKGAGMIPGMARAAGAGGAQELLTPETQYDPLLQAAKGAAFGVGGDVVGRLAGRAYAPFRDLGSTTAQENAAILNKAGLPYQIPATQTDSSMTKAMTDALEQIPIVGAGVRNARAQNRAWGTGKFVEPTGMAPTELTPSTLSSIEGKANDTLNTFRAGPDVPTSAIPPRLQALATELGGTPTIASKNSLVNKVENLGSDLTPVANNAPLPRPGIYNTIEQSAIQSPQSKVGSTLEQAAAESGPTALGGKTIAQAPPTQPVVGNTTRTADEMMNLRNEASKMAHGSGSYLEKKAGADLQDVIEQAIRDTHGDQGAAFDLALKRWGATKDVTRAAGDFGEHLIGGHLPPERMVAGGREYQGMFPERDRLVGAMAGNMPTPPRGWNRAMITSAMLGGTPMALGVGADYMKGDVGLGTAAGTGLSASIIAGLSRKAPPQQRIDALRKLLTAAGIGTGQQF